MKAEDYEALLKRAKSNLKIDITSQDRFVLPKLDIISEGKNTIVRNFGDFTDKVRRNKEEVVVYLQKELGAACLLEDKRLVIKSRIYPNQIIDKLNDYVDMYVICHECNRPDTNIKKVGKVLMLVCEACGAVRPITASKRSKEESAQIDIGKIYAVKIQNVDKNGYGISKIGDFTIWVAGKPSINKQVNVKIDKIADKEAYGHIVK
ncbi:MAG: translation initiation factor IF-2 subunit beta [Thermoplasmata archaeon]